MAVDVKVHSFNTTDNISTCEFMYMWFDDTLDSKDTLEEDTREVAEIRIPARFGYCKNCGIL